MLYVLTWRCIVPSPPPNTSPKLHFYIKHFPIQKILSFNPDWSLLSKVQFYLEELEIYRSIHYSVPLLLYIVSNSVPGGAVYQGIGFRRAWGVEHINSLTSNNQTASFRADYKHPRGGVASPQQFYVSSKTHSEWISSTCLRLRTTKVAFTIETIHHY